MTHILRIAAAALGLAMASTAANAAVIDFTDPTTFTVAGSSITGTGFDELTAIGGDFNISEAGPGPIGPLAGTIDGIGIGDDEISFPTESITLDFGTGVTLSSLFLLDFFEGERVFVSNGIDTILLTTAGGDAAGFFTGAVGLVGSIFTLTPDIEDDNPTGVGDFALAGVEIAPIPLPAGLLLLGGALGGLTIARRRKARA